MTDGKHNRSSDDDGEGPSSKKPRTDEPSDDSDKYTTTDSESGEGGDDPEEGGEKSEEDEDEPEEGDEEPEGDDEPEEEDDDPEEGDDNPEEGDNDPEEGGDDPEEDNNDPEEGDDDPEEGDEESKEDEEDREDNGDEPEDETPAGGVLSAPDLPSDDSDRYTTSESSKDSPEGGDKTRKDDDDDPEERSDEYGEGDYRTEDRSSESEGDSAFTTSIKASGLQPPRSLAQEGWKGVETIGEGGFGVALRYSRTVDRIDKDGEKTSITEHIVVKVIELEEDTYNNADNYEIDEEDPDVVDKKKDMVEQEEDVVDKDNWVPLEAFCQRAALARDPPDPRYSLLLRAWSKDDNKRQWRLYSEYCAFQGKTLENLINAHSQKESEWSKESKKNAEDSEDDGDDEEKDGRQDDGKEELAHQPIPEPAIWYFAECMARAAIGMKTCPGLSTNKRNLATTAGREVEIVHFDIKPDNVFLDLPDPNRFKAYPIAKLADFGGAKYTWAGHDKNPFDEFQRTAGYVSPEMYLDEDGAQLQAMVPENQLAACNVWQIGKVLMSMMLLENRTRAGSGQIDYGEHNDEDVSEEWKPSFEHLRAQGEYSDELVDLVEECVEPEIINRPLPEALLSSILSRGAGKLDGMDTIDQGSENVTNRLRLVMSNKSKYAEGFAGEKIA